MGLRSHFPPLNPFIWSGKRKEYWTGIILERLAVRVQGLNLDEYFSVQCNETIKKHVAAVLQIEPKLFEEFSRNFESMQVEYRYEPVSLKVKELLWRNWVVLIEGNKLETY